MFNNRVNATSRTQLATVQRCRKCGRVHWSHAKITQDLYDRPIEDGSFIGSLERTHYGYINIEQFCPTKREWSYSSIPFNTDTYRVCKQLLRSKDLS